MKLRKIANNQTVIETAFYEILVSYETPVACYSRETGTYHRTEQKWSATTSKHINAWLNGAGAMEQKQKFFDELLNCA